MPHVERMIEFTATCPFTHRASYPDRQKKIPDCPKEAYRQGIDDGEVLFARRLRSAMNKERSLAAA